MFCYRQLLCEFSLESLLFHFLRSLLFSSWCFDLPRLQERNYKEAGPSSQFLLSFNYDNISCYGILLLQSVSKSSRSFFSNSGQHCSRGHNKIEEVKITKILFAILVVFLVCWTHPFTLKFWVPFEEITNCSVKFTSLYFTLVQQIVLYLSCALRFDAEDAEAISRCNILNTRNSVSSGYSNNEKRDSKCLDSQ